MLLGLSGHALAADAPAALCLQQGQMVRSIAAVRDAGASEALAKKTLIAADSPIRSLLDSTIVWVYASPQPPDVLAAQVEAACRKAYSVRP